MPDVKQKNCFQEDIVQLFPKRGRFSKMLESETSSENRAMGRVLIIFDKNYLMDFWLRSTRKTTEMTNNRQLF